MITITELMADVLDSNDVCRCDPVARAALKLARLVERSLERASEDLASNKRPETVLREVLESLTVIPREIAVYEAFNDHMFESIYQDVEDACSDEIIEDLLADGVTMKDISFRLQEEVAHIAANDCDMEIEGIARDLSARAGDDDALFAELMENL